MTPEQQAQDLVNQFAIVTGYRNERQCALIAVTEILNAIPHWSDCAMSNEPAMPNGECDCKNGDYWRLVKGVLVATSEVPK